MRRIVMALFCAVLITAMAPFAGADVTFSPFEDNASDSSGNWITDGTWLMILDANHNGINGASYLSQPAVGVDTSSSWRWDSNDIVLGRGAFGSIGLGSGNPLDDGYINPTVIVPSSQLPASYSSGLDHVILLWFNQHYSLAAAGPGVNVRYAGFDLGAVSADPGNYAPEDTVGGNATLRTQSAAPPNPFSNQSLASDVNGDGSVSPIDALLIINKLNSQGEHNLQQPGDPIFGSGGYYWDVTNDSPAHVSSDDASAVIAELNTMAGVSGPQLQLEVSNGPSGALTYSLATVPEPTSCLLLLVGGGLLTVGRLKRVRSRRKA